MPCNEGPYTADYTVLTKFGNTTTSRQRRVGSVAAIGDRRRRAVPHRRRRITDLPARHTTDPCSSSIDPARISDTQITPDFYAADAAKRLRRSAVARIGTPVAHVDQIAGQSATCVDVPVPGGTSVFCALAERSVGQARRRRRLDQPHAVLAGHRRSRCSRPTVELAVGSGVDADQCVIDVVDRQRARIGGNHDVFEAHAPPPGR